MKKFLGVVLFSLSLLASTAHASPDAPKAGVDDTVLPQPQPVSVPAGKIEVIEFFWYGCPHCADFEPKLEAWAKTKGDDVVLRRIPVAFRPDFEPHSRLFHALDVLGVAEQLTPKVFNEIQVNKNYLLTPEAQAAFVAKNGVDPKKFLDAYNSFGVQSAVKRDATMLNDYHVDGTPTLVVQGKYATSPALTNSLDGAVKVVSWLDAQIRANKM
jgi:thiol:disulfide interchange protein DsbA